MHHHPQAYTALGAFYVPLVVTVISYAAIFVLLWKKMRAKDRRRSRSSRRRASSTVPGIAVNGTELKELGRRPRGGRQDDNESQVRSIVVNQPERNRLVRLLLTAFLSTWQPPPRLSVPRRVSKEASTDEYSLGSAEAKAEELDREPER